MHRSVKIESYDNNNYHNHHKSNSAVCRDDDGHDSADYYDDDDDDNEDPADEESVHGRNTIIKRSRTSRACDVCRKKRIKCSGSPPCTSCQNLEKECIFTNPGKKRGPIKHQSIEKIHQRLDAIEELLHKFLAHNQLSRPYGSRSPSSNVSQPRPTPPFFPPSSPNSYVKARQSPCNNTTSTTHSAAALNSETKLKKVKKQSVPLLNQPEIQDSIKVVLIQDQHVAGNILFFGSTAVTTSSVFKNYSKNHEGVFSLNIINDSKESVIPPPTIQPPCSFDLTVRLSENYFEIIHPFLPMLNRQWFMKNLMERSTSWHFLMVSSAVLAVTCLWTPSFSGWHHDRIQPRDLHTYFLRRARAYLHANLDYPNITSVQTMILLVLCGTAGNRASNPWIYNGLATRMCQEIGLHRNLDKYNLRHPEMDEETKDTMRRVWFCCYLLDRFSSTATGRPSAIDDADFDTSYPNANDSDVQYLILQVKIMSIFGRMASFVNSVQTGEKKREEFRIDIEARLNEWQALLPAEVKNVRLGSIWNVRLFLVVLYHVAIVLLHRCVGNRLDDPQCLNSASIITTLISALPMPQASASAPEFPIPALPFTMYSLLTAATCWTTRIMSFKAQLAAAQQASTHTLKLGLRTPSPVVPTYEIQQYVVLISTCERLAGVNGRARRQFTLLKEFLNTPELVPYMMGIIDTDGRPILATLGLPLSSITHNHDTSSNHNNNSQYQHKIIENNNPLNILNQPQGTPPVIITGNTNIGRLPAIQSHTFYPQVMTTGQQPLPAQLSQTPLFGGVTLGSISPNSSSLPSSATVIGGSSSSIIDISPGDIGPGVLHTGTMMGLGLQSSNMTDTFVDLIRLWESQDPFDLPF